MGCTGLIWTTLLLLFLFLSVALVAAQSQNVAAPSTDGSYPDSADGLGAQVGNIVSVVHSNDQAAIRTALDSLGIPNADKWFAAHFDPRFAAKLTSDYATALSAYQSHISWVPANFSKSTHFAPKVHP